MQNRDIFFSTQLPLLICTALLLLSQGDSWMHFDTSVYLQLNHSLTFSQSWAQFWGYLNHRNENWMNLVVMVGLQFCILFARPAGEKLNAFVHILYCWFCFQFLLLFEHVVFSDWLQIARESASIVMPPEVSLSQLLNNPNIKEISHSSFPAGHAMVAMFWWAATLLMKPGRLVFLISTTVLILLCVNRLFTGAHWLSDVIYGIVLGLAGFGWAYCTRLYPKTTLYLERKLANLST